MNCEPTRVAWTWRHAVCASDLAPTTRHVLLTLSMFMNELGESCHPSTADLCRYSGLDKKTVLKHIAAARDAGWIDVSQHGYRGQKWKRQEYAARWPDRDIVAPCAPDDGEGGGNAPPPSGAEKVVESTAEGGGTEGPKVVEHVHQDKTSPGNIPNTSPVEREARARGSEDRKIVERWLKRVHPSWPSFVSDSGDRALAAALSLTPQEREQAADRMADYLAVERQNKGRCAFAVYLAEKRWERLPAKEPEKPKPAYAPAFGPVWAARRARLLLGGPMVQTPLKAWEERAIEAGTLSREAAETSARRNGGWPVVNAMHEAAAQRGNGYSNPDPVDERLGKLCEFVPVDCDCWRAWKAEHERLGWPWLPDPGTMRGAYFPAGGPERLGEFEAAVRSCGEQVQEAAE